MIVEGEGEEGTATRSRARVACRALVPCLDLENVGRSVGRSVRSPLCSPSSMSVASNAGYCTTTTSASAPGLGPLPPCLRRPLPPPACFFGAAAAAAASSTETETRLARRPTDRLSAAAALPPRPMWCSLACSPSQLPRARLTQHSRSRSRSLPLPRWRSFSTGLFLCLFHLLLHSLLSSVRCGGRFNHFTHSLASLLAPRHATASTRTLSLSISVADLQPARATDGRGRADGGRDTVAAAAEDPLSVSLPSLPLSRSSEAGGRAGGMPSLERPISQNRYEDGRWCAREG